MTEKIYIQNNDEIIELKGQDLQDFLEDRKEIQADMALRAQQISERETKSQSALSKLKALGLTESEAKIIIGLE